MFKLQRIDKPQNTAGGTPIPYKPCSNVDKNDYYILKAFFS